MFDWIGLPVPTSAREPNALRSTPLRQTADHSPTQGRSKEAGSLAHSANTLSRLTNDFRPRHPLEARFVWRKIG